MLPIPFLKKGKTGILDKGSLQGRIFYFIFGTNREHSEKGQNGRLK